MYLNSKKGDDDGASSPGISEREEPPQTSPPQTTKGKKSGSESVYVKEEETDVTGTEAYPDDEQK